MAQILMIEDENEIRTSLLKIFKYEDFDVIGASNGREGIDLAKAHLPELVICDISMPGVDGYDVLLELRKTPSTATIPFIFLTAKGGEQAVRKGMQLGADDYLTKPFKIDALLSTIRVRLEKQQLLKQQSSQQLEEFRLVLSSTLPHELQTPLSGIMGFAQLLIGLGPEDLPSAEKIIEFQREILGNADRLQHLIENYLLYTKLKLMEYQSESHSLWEETFGLYSPKTVLQWGIQEKAAVHHRQDDVEFELVEGDVRSSEILLKKIAEELIDNACKFSDPGTPIRITSSLNAEQFCFCVEDRGRGMSSEQLKQIGAFTQFDRAKYEQQGAGLGLAIVQLLAAQHQAECLIESTMGAGTSVSVIFHLNRQTHEQPGSGANQS